LSNAKRPRETRGKKRKELAPGLSWKETGCRWPLKRGWGGFQKKTGKKPIRLKKRQGVLKATGKRGGNKKGKNEGGGGEKTCSGSLKQRTV